jgi:cbb3-type cytochrome oxidase subunit 3
MFKYIFRTQEGRDILAAIPLVLFFTVFVGAVIWLFIINKKQAEQMANLPLEDGTKGE